MANETAKKTLKTRIKLKRDTSANWEKANPVLLNGEIIIVDTANNETRTKTGDGTKTYTQLPFDDEGTKGGKGLSTCDYTAEDKAEVDKAVIKGTNYCGDSDDIYLSGYVEPGGTVYAPCGIKLQPGNASTPAELSVGFENENYGTKITGQAIEGKMFDSSFTLDYNDLVCNGQIGTHKLSEKVNTSDVLTKTNTTEFTPTSDYHPATKKYVDDSVANKVDKVEGKGLSTNDLTDDYKSKLDALNSNLAGKATNTSVLRTTVPNQPFTPKTDYHPATKKYVDDSVANKVDKVSGKGLSTNDFTAAYKSKLDNLDSKLNAKAPAYSYGTTDLTAGTSTLTTGKLHFVYE